MNISSLAQDCHETLTRLGQQDPFLGQADQRPRIDQELNRLAQRLAMHEEEIATHFGNLIEEMRRNLSEVSGMFQKTHAQLEKDLAPLAASAPPDETVLRALETSLDELVRRLSRRTRSRASGCVPCNCMVSTTVSSPSRTPPSRAARCRTPTAARSTRW